MKKTIITAAITTVLVNFLLYLLSGWAIFLMVWIALGFWARKIAIKDSVYDDPVVYGLVWVVPICVLISEATCKDSTDKIMLFIKDKLPKFRNPFVWPEKSE